MRDNLIAFIKGFTTIQDGSEHRDEISLGKSGQIVLVFGYGYHPANKITMWDYSTPQERPKSLSVEDAVDEFMKFYKLT